PLVFQRSAARRGSSPITRVDDDRRADREANLREALARIMECSAFCVPGCTKKDDHRRELHPYHQADRRGQPSVNGSILHMPDVNSKQQINAPPQNRRCRRSRQNGTPRCCAWSRKTINQGQDEHRQGHPQDRKHDRPEAASHGRLAESASHPLAQWPSKDTQRDGQEPHHNRHTEREQASKLSAEKGTRDLLRERQAVYPSRATPTLLTTALDPVQESVPCWSFPSSSA